MFDDELKRIFVKIKKRNLEKPDEIPTISLSQIKKIAKSLKLSLKEIEIAALKEGIAPARYIRNFDTISFTEQIALLNSKAAVVGCGGLGGNILELLARLGIGSILAIDGDIFQESNLNRQRLCCERSLGKNKAITVLSKIKQINSSISIQPCSHFINTQNIVSIIKDYDVIIDALDNIPLRFVIEKACRKLKIPFIHGAINGLQGQVSTIFPQDAGLSAIYGPEDRYKKYSPDKGISVLSVTPAMIASLQVTEVLKVLLNRGNLLRNKLLLINLEYSDFNIVEIS